MEKRTKNRARQALDAASSILLAAMLALAVAGAPSAASARTGAPAPEGGAGAEQHHRHGEGIGHPTQGGVPEVLSPADSAAGGKVTVLVYMNGSDLESYGGAATSDIAEMLGSGVGENANVVIETVGTREWQDFGIASDRAQRYAVEDGKLALVDDSLDQLDATAPETLSGFLSWGKANYPADRYFLVLWDHGAGPVYGFGYDEFQSEESALTLDEMKQALDENGDMRFDFIGMDCCIMGSIETTAVLAPFCDYAVLSEDFEPGIGWSYARWLSALEENPGIGTAELGRIVVDDMVDAAAADEENGDAVLALVDESKVPALHRAWEQFAFANSDALLASDISRRLEWAPVFESSKAARPGSGSFGSVSTHDGVSGCDCTPGCGWACDCGYEYGTDYACDDGEGYNCCYDRDCGDAAGQGSPWLWAWLWGEEPYDGCDYGYDDDGLYSFWEDWEYDGSYVTMTDYFVTDLGAAAATAGDGDSIALEEALDAAIAYCKSTDGDADLCGLGVTLPYGDGEFYDALEDVFSKCGFDGDYIGWLEAFAGVDGQDG